MTMTAKATAGLRAKVKRPRWRRVIAAATAIAAALGIGGYLLTTTSHRLKEGDWSWKSAEAERRTAGPTTEIRYVFKRGGQLTFGASISNPGPWPVTITSVAIGDLARESHLYKVAALTMWYTDGRSTTNSATAPIPFAATTVAAGAELCVYVTMTMPDVESASGTVRYFHKLAVTYQVLGMTRHELVPMGFYLSMETPEA